MIEKTRGIILHSVRYGESSLIMTVYTEKFGRQSYIISAARGARSKNKAGLLQPLFILDFEVYIKKSRELQRIKEFRVVTPYTSIPFNVTKTAQVIFLSEVLYKVLQEEEANEQLFRFLESSLLYFDISAGGLPAFHIWLMAHLTEYLGIFPNLTRRGEGWFDMQKGILVASEPAHPLYMNPVTSVLLNQILSLPIQDLHGFQAGSSERNLLLQNILEYYHQQFNNMGHIKSLQVLREVFH
jgi:DNA repair protein RecO (recombination protein O)